MISFNKEQIFLVTGASSGLGEGTALLLNELGATVVGIARNEERLNGMKAKCKYPENMHLEIKDLTEDIENLPQYVKELKNKYGKFSGLAYCAGISNVSPLQSLDFKYTKKMFDINYFAPVFLTKGFIDRRNNVGKDSSIVAISSIAAIKCDKGHASYSGAKAALSSSMKAIAREVASQGIRINCVLPSMIATPMTLNPNIKDLDQNKINTNEYPFGWGEVSDVVNLIIYLLSNNAKFISGQNYVIDSGGVI
mgnify:CR=1 FL=1